ncbi:hypothetical protein QEV83_13870 [Methylocapsa sp. D3K7]|uniref:hypothetical protein n=1 Tax=Methylocapsa sp. D3K7 TaxID=3041435 RepID=UPI00244F0159|nr:hypothetical protein [Methylocapsa sp. D3K7]WGJ13763.1 hypothetical protein QEV83_13870 [Methylocapsa sp. D3K7]
MTILFRRALKAASQSIAGIMLPVKTLQTEAHEDSMKLAIALAAALISTAPVTAFAQGTGTGDRGDQESHVGPGSENRDNGPYGDPRSMQPPSDDPDQEETPDMPENGQ